MSLVGKRCKITKLAMMIKKSSTLCLTDSNKSRIVLFLYTFILISRNKMSYIEQIKMRVFFIFFKKNKNPYSVRIQCKRL